MPRLNITAYKLLLSCPGDVLDLKNTVDDCVKSFNTSIGEINNIRIDLMHWSTDSFSQSGDKPQNILNKQFINDCDMCVALLGARFGTPTDNYDSGTEEEIEKMIEEGKQVFLYFIDRPTEPSKMDLAQYQKVKEFKNKYADKGLYRVVKNSEELRSHFQNDLTLYFIQLINSKTTQFQPVLMPKLIIKSSKDNDTCIVPFHTDYVNIKLVEDKEDAIKEMIRRISDISIIPSSEVSPKDNKSVISGEEIQEMTFGEIMDAFKSKKITSDQFYKFMGKDCPEYQKVEFDEEQHHIISDFCNRHNIELDDNFYYLGNLKKEIRLSVLTSFGNNMKSFLGSDEEKGKYELVLDLIQKIEELNDVVDFFESIDAKLCVSLQIENQGNTFDEDIDVKLFIKKGDLVDVDYMPKPGELFLEEAVELEAPRSLFSGHHDAEIEDFSNYPVIPYIPQPIYNPFKSAEEELAEKQEEYQEMLENVFCYDKRENTKEDILCFNVPYLKQNTKMFFPSYLFFNTIPGVIRYEIRSKHSPDVYTETLTFRNELDS